MTRLVRLLCVLCVIALGCQPPRGPKDGRFASHSGGAGSVTTVKTKPTSPVPVEADDAQWGDATAPVTIVAFLDLECPFCARVEPVLTELEQRYGPTRLRVVWKHFPLPFHAHAAEAAKASRAALELGGNKAFFAFTSALFSDPGGLGPSAYTHAAEKAGIAAAALLARAGTPNVEERIQKDMDLAGSIGVGGTPHFFINGVRIEGLVPIAMMDAIIARELEAAQALTAHGVAPGDVYGVRSTENYARAEQEARQTASVEDDDTKLWAVPVGSSPRQGPDDALVTIIEFSDYQCPFCKRVQPTLDEVRKRYGADVRIVWKHYPLPFHDHALHAAVLSAEARAEKGDAGFWKATEALFDASPNLDDARLAEIGRTLKLDGKKVRKALEEHAQDAVIEADQSVAARFKVTGTPHFFINGRRLVGAQPLEEFVRIIDEELTEAHRLIEHGTQRARVYDERLKNAASADDSAAPAH